MIRLLATGVCALFLVGCTAKTETPAAGNNPAAASVATDTKAKFEIGQTL